MLMLASFVFSVLLLLGWGRPDNLLFYVPVACFGLLIVWIASRSNARGGKITNERPVLRRTSYWR